MLNEFAPYKRFNQFLLVWQQLVSMLISAEIAAANATGSKIQTHQTQRHLRCLRVCVCCVVVCKINVWSQWRVIDLCLVCLCGVRTQCRIDFRPKNNASFCLIIKNIIEINAKVLLSNYCSQFQIFAAFVFRRHFFVLKILKSICLNSIFRSHFECSRSNSLHLPTANDTSAVANVSCVDSEFVDYYLWWKKLLSIRKNKWNLRLIKLIS